MPSDPGNNMKDTEFRALVSLLDDDDPGVVAVVVVVVATESWEHKITPIKATMAPMTSNKVVVVGLLPPPPIPVQIQQQEQHTFPTNNNNTIE